LKGFPLIVDIELELAVLGGGFASQILALFLEIGVFGAHTEESSEKVDCVLEVADFLGSSGFSDETLFLAETDVVPGFPVGTLVGKDVDTSSGGGAEYCS